ncbi:MAG: hypothetical protein HQL34_12335 [Alphaproteobacteria bacterium]|nr:hypothetical protein [Alphaproteobacteria bacterium]
MVGFARLITSLTASDMLILEDNGSEQIVVRHTDTGSIAIDRGATQLALSSGSLLPNTWTFIEVKAVIADSGGSVTVRVNGADFVSVSNADTKATATASANSVKFWGSGGSGATVRYDDIYILDGTGAINDFLGDHRVRTLLPAADDSVQFARSTGAYNYANVIVG